MAGPNTYEHVYAECSAKGDCDRKTGVCNCYGVCETLKRESSDSYNGWDAEKIQKCVCDPGYEGVRCEKKTCKKGDDPMTLANLVSGSWSAQAAEVQTIATAIMIEEALEALPNEAIPSVTVTGTSLTAGSG